MKSDIVTSLSIPRAPEAGTQPPAAQESGDGGFGRTLETWRGQMAAQGARADRARTLDAARAARAEPAPPPAPEGAPRDPGAATANAARDSRRQDERTQQSRRDAASRAETRSARPARADAAPAAQEAPDTARQAAQDADAATDQATGAAEAEPAQGKGRTRGAERADAATADPAALVPAALQVASAQPANAKPGTMPTEGPAPAAGARHGLPKAAGLADPAGRAAGAEPRAAGPALDPGVAPKAAGTDVSTRDFAALLGREQRRHDGVGPDMQAAVAPLGAPGAQAVGTPVAASGPAGAPATDYTIAAPVGSDGFPNGLTETVSLVLADGLESAQIEIHPPEMGPVKIELSLDGTDARMVFTAAQPETRQAIEQSAPLLRSMLSEQGLSLSGFDVGAGRQFDQRGRDGQAAPGDGPAARGGGVSGTGGADAAIGPLPRPAARARGLLDLFA